MPLTLVLGPANSSKAGEVLGAYGAAANRGALLVVPTGADAEHYRRELAEHGSVLGSVVTFGGLVDGIARRVGYDGRRLTTLQRERVVRRAVRGAGLGLLRRAAEARGFAVAAGELIAELERSLVAPQRFAQAMHAWAAEDERRRPYAHDVASIYQAYSRQLERLGRPDRELFAWRALDQLRAAPGLWGGEPVFFYGFDDLNPLERDAIETLARVVGVEVTVSLTYEAGRAALAARAETVEELRPLAERVLELPPLEDFYEPAARAALHHLERGLFETGAGRVDPGGAVRLLEAGGESSEAELVAAEVLELIRAGIAAEEIVVVHRSPRRSAPVLGRVFEQYGIPAAIADRVPLAHTALGRSVLALARCALLADGEASAEDLLSYLRAPGLVERAQLLDELEADVRCGGLRTAQQARERLGWRLAELDAVGDSPDPGRELLRQARRMLAAPHRGSAEPRILSSAEELDARALAAMQAALAELEDLGETLSGQELIELLAELEVPVGTKPRAGAVLVSDPLAIRARRFRAVFVCGLEENEFPVPAAPEPFLPDELRRELAAVSGLALRRGEDTLGRERYLFYACVSRATERVVLSYRSSDEEGNIALRSPFVDDIAELLAEGWLQQRRRRMLSDVVWPAGEAPTARELERTLAAAAAPRFGELVSPIRGLAEPALRHVRHREIVSGGALEAYADCPVKWLVERELQPAPLEPEPDPLARGRYMHEALEEVLRGLGRAVTPATLAEANAVLAAVLAELSAAIAPGRPEGIRRAALRMIEADLRRYLAHEASDGCEWQPTALELRFGFEDEQASLPALELDGVRVRGAIDRVDVDPTGRRAIVRDYKSGSVRPEHQGNRWRSDRQLQVALYMLAVRELLGLEPVAGLYQPLGGRDLRARGVFLADEPPGTRLVDGDGRDAEGLRAELEDAAARAIALAARLREGGLEPCPQTCSRDGCKYPAICRVS